MVGTTVSHYLIEERIGAGGMGEVYRAQDVRLGRRVALKFPQANYFSDPEERDRLLREARAASSLQSSHIAAIYDIGEYQGAPFIVMEFVDGETVADRLKRGPLTLRDAVKLALQTADALSDAHDRGIVHRDIKTANLIVTDRGQLKVLDFGLAKFVGPQATNVALTRATNTSPGILQGTFSYMSPEQALGRPVDHRTDLFSLGVVVFEMAAGRLPFDGTTVTEILDKVINHDPPALSRFVYDAPPLLEAVVRKALAKDPAYRYQSSRELYIDLRSTLQELDASRRDTSTSRRAVETSGERERAVQNAVAVLTFSNITREPADEWIGAGIAETVTADLKNVQGLEVIARAQVFDALRNLTGRDAPELDDSVALDVGRRLGANWIVRGGYQRLGSTIRITAQFSDVRTGAIVRTVKIDGRIDDLFNLQDRIVFELSQGLNLRLRDSEKADIEQQETNSMEAYEAYSRGMMNLRMAGRDAMDRAITLFEKAVAIDPAYARAWAALGQAYELKGSFLSLPEVLEKSVEALRRAIQLRPQLAQAHALLGSALRDLGRHDEALAAATEAVRLEPENAGIRMSLARAYWIGQGRIPEAIRELEKVVADNPQSGYSQLQLGLLRAFEGDYAGAEEASGAAIALQEQYLSGTEGLLIVGAHTRLGYVYYLQERYEEALREYERELVFLSTTDHALRERSVIELEQKIGAAYKRKGDPDEATRHLSRAIRLYQARRSRGADDAFTKYYVAVALALTGDLERATNYLDEVLATLRALTLYRVRIDADLEAVRATPWYAAVTQS